MRSWLQPILQRLQRAATLPKNDLLRDAVYRRLWTSILISSFGGQVTMLALPLTAAVLLHATPTQMGVLTFIEIVPFLLFSLPSGVLLDRVRKMPVYVVGETTLAFAVASVPLAWALDVLTMGWLYAVGFVLGTIYTVAGSAAQIVLTQVVSRDRLVEAHAKNALASSGAEVAGPGVAGVLIKLVGAPLALLVDAVLLIVSAAILRGVEVNELRKPRPDANFWKDLKAGVDFVRRHRLLVALAASVGGWQMCHQAALVVTILFATRTLGLSEQAVGLSYVARCGHGHGERVRAPDLGVDRPGAEPGAGHCGVRPGLAGTVAGTGQRVRCGRVRIDAAAVRHRRGADLHQLPRAAAGGNARAAAGADDEHDALVDAAAGRAGCADRRLARRACGLALGAGVCRRRRAAAGGGGVAPSGDPRRHEPAEAA
jgi:hypothetical protein